MTVIVVLGTYYLGFLVWVIAFVSYITFFTFQRFSTTFNYVQTIINLKFLIMCDVFLC